MGITWAACVYEVQRQGLDLPLAAIALFKQACTLGLCTRPCLFVLPEPFTHTHTRIQTDSTYTHHSLCTMRRAVLAGPQLRPPQQRDGNTADGFSCFLTHRRRSRAHGSKLMPANDSRFATQIALEYEFASRVVGAFRCRRADSAPFLVFARIVSGRAF